MKLNECQFFWSEVAILLSKELRNKYTDTWRCDLLAIRCVGGALRKLEKRKFTIATGKRGCKAMQLQKLLDSGCTIDKAASCAGTSVQYAYRVSRDNKLANERKKSDALKRTFAYRVFHDTLNSSLTALIDERLSLELIDNILLSAWHIIAPSIMYIPSVYSQCLPGANDIHDEFILHKKMPLSSSVKGSDGQQQNMSVNEIFYLLIEGDIASELFIMQLASSGFSEIRINKSAALFQTI